MSIESTPSFTEAQPRLTTTDTLAAAHLEQSASPELFDTRPLHDGDLGWLSRLADRSITPDDIAKLDDAAYELASLDLRTDIDPQLRHEAEQARKLLYEDILGWDQPSHSAHAAYQQFLEAHPTIAPITTTVAVLRYLDSRGIVVGRSHGSWHGLLAQDCTTIHAKFENLTSLGLDATNVVNKSLQALSCNPDSVQVKMQNLTDLGLDAANVVNKSPSALCYNPDSVQVKMQNLIALGLDAANVVNKSPSALGLNPESVQAKMQNLTELGLDAANIVNKFPSVLACNPNALRIKFHMLKAAGYDITLFSPSQISTLVTMPTDTIACKLYDSKSTDRDEATLSRELWAYRKSHNLTTAPARAEHFRQNYPDIYAILGCSAVHHARYAKRDTWSHLSGETIPAESLLSRPEEWADVTGKKSQYSVQ